MTAFTLNINPASLTLLILCIIVFVVSNIIFMPLEIYYTGKLYKYKDSLIIAKRKPGLVVIGVTFASSFFLLTTGYAVWCIITDSYFHRQWLIPIFIPIALFSWYIYIARLWLLFYQIQFNIESIAMKWQSIIDNRIPPKWYHSHKQTLGSFISTTIILTIYELVTIAIVILLIVGALRPLDHHWTSIYYTFHWIFSIFSLYIPLLLILFIACKIPSHYDSIGLIKEVKITAHCFTVIVLSSSVVDLILVLTEYIDLISWSFTTIDMLYLCILLLWRIVFFIACMIQTRFPVKTFGPILEHYSRSTAVKICHQATLEELKTINEDSLEDCTDDPQTMKHVLKNNESFELFIKHCSNEHCLECILSVIEFIQFKDKLYKCIINDDNQYTYIQHMDETEKYLILPTSCPQSAIVYNENISHKEIARKLYRKYIKVGSPFEINLSYTQRKKYSRLMEQKSSWLKETKYNSDGELLLLFDICIKEMCRLLASAFSRYKQSNQYQILKRHSFD